MKKLSIFYLDQYMMILTLPQFGRWGYQLFSEEGLILEGGVIDGSLLPLQTADSSGLILQISDEAGQQSHTYRLSNLVDREAMQGA